MNTPDPPPDRRSDLDALRAVAMLLGIVLHAALAFCPAFWVVSDRRQDPVCEVLVSVIHGFRMPAFFVMSGYFSAMLLHRRGRGSMVSQRFRRVLLPLLVGMGTVVPLTNWISGLAMSSASQSHNSNSDKEKELTIGAAADVGDLKTIEQRLASGAALNALDDEMGVAPLHRAALSNRVEAIELLIGRGADVNVAAPDGGTPLHAAAFVGHVEAVAALLKHGANVNAPNKRGGTPLDVATLDEGTTLYFASLLKLPLNTDNLGSRKAAIAEQLRQHGGTAGQTQSLTNILMQIPIFSHLWFLWFLWWLALGLAAVSAVFSRLPAIRIPSWLVISPACYLWLIPLTMAPQAFMEIGGFGPDTSSGPLPIPHVFAYYAIFFGFGALYYQVDDRNAQVTKRWWIPLGIALLVIFPLSMALSKGWGAALDPQFRRVLSTGLQAAYPWLMTFGLMGLFRRLFTVESPTMRYLSDSAYWLYLAHLPLVIAAQWAVRDWPLPALVKLALIVAVVTLFLLGTYQTLVRYTWLGRFLNGPRTRPERTADPVVSVPAA